MAISMNQPCWVFMKYPSQHKGKASGNVHCSIESGSNGKRSSANYFQSRMNFGSLLAICLLAAAFWLIVGIPLIRDDESKILIQAKNKYSLQEYSAAMVLVKKILESDPTHQQALLFAGQTASKLHEYQRAIDYFEQVVPQSSEVAFQKLYGLAERYWMMNQVVEAERYFREAHLLNPAHLPTNRYLSELLYIQGRTWEAIPFLRTRIVQGDFIADQLRMIGATENSVLVDDFVVNRSLKAKPEHPIILLGTARIHLLQNRTAQAKKLLLKIVAAHPEIAEAQGRLGQIYALENSSDFLAWNRSLPAKMDEHPEIWRARANWARVNKQPRAAIRCFSEVLLRHPYHVTASYELSQLIAEVKGQQAAQVYFERAKELSNLQTLLGELQGNCNFTIIHQVIEILEKQQRFLEATAWADMALRELHPPDWATTSLESSRRDALLDIQTVNSRQAGQAQQLLDYPLPDWEAGIGNNSQIQLAATSISSPRFSNEAEKAGIDFRYISSLQENVGLEHIFDTTGAGMAVLDYNLDGWPDIYLAQGCQWKDRQGSKNYPDRLYQNLGNGQFKEVTDQSGLGDINFSQGVTAGDFNSDGYPDLYICNLYENCLYINNGDGTFSDITKTSQTAGDEWSLSAGFGDFNQDGLADLYVVNYLDRMTVIEQSCKTENGHIKACAPTMFPGTMDRLYLNNGDGSFKDVSVEAGLDVTDAKGLGLLVSDFDQSGKLSIFVGNDTAANFFFTPTMMSKESVRFEEHAGISGLAFNWAGQTQATMGIAVGDANQDGLLDLFATNFYADANTLYLQDDLGLFTDATRMTNLQDSGYYMLGFGAQFIDADLDGYLDIIVTNGHVDRTFATGEPDLMQAQFFKNLGGTFNEISPEKLGPFFDQKGLGRGLAVLDWNRDGKQDVIIAHLDAPFALLTNTTPKTGHFITLKLIGTSCAREPIGTTVRVHASGKIWTQQLTAGNGYETCNEKKLIFGLGKTVQIDKIEVEWIDGKKSEFENVKADTHWIIQQGNNSLLNNSIRN